MKGRHGKVHRHKKVRRGGLFLRTVPSPAVYYDSVQVLDSKIRSQEDAVQTTSLDSILNPSRKYRLPEAE